MLWLHKDKFVKLGKELAPEEFLKLLDKKWESNRSVCWDQARDLLRGAVEDFHAGHRANVQAVLADDTARMKHSDIFYSVLEESSDKRADLALMTAAMPEEARKGFLQLWLKTQCYNNNKELRDLLMEAGAEVPVNDALFFATIIVDPDASVETITFLHEQGCSFQKAMAFMVKNDWEANNMEKLKFYRQTIEGAATDAAPAAATQDTLAKILETQQQMAEQIRALTARVASLQSPAPPAPPAPVVRALSSKPYPHI